MNLITDDEREQFIGLFWQRCNPVPGSEENIFKDEYYRRIAYANDRFAASVQGWKTDRGRVYIKFGRPDEIESYSNGGAKRSPEGGIAISYPWEKWKYRYLEGIGADVELDFVDPARSRDYRLTIDSSEKDLPLYGPEWKKHGAAVRTPASTEERQRLQLYFKTQPLPEVKFKGLEALVTSRMIRNQIPFKYRVDFIRVTSDTNLALINVEVPDSELTFQNEQGVQRGHINLFGRISALGGRVLETFEQAISRDQTEAMLEPSPDMSAIIYQKIAPLRPGLYRLDLAIKDEGSGNVSVVHTRFGVPRYQDDLPEASTLILADKVEPAPLKPRLGEHFMLGSLKVRPRASREFTGADKIGAFLQVYNLKVDEKTHESSVSVIFQVTEDEQEIWKQVENSDQLHPTGEQVSIHHPLPLASLQPGRYKIEIIATDQLTNRSVSRTEDFTVKPGPAPKTSGK